jgi:HAMP domain-containing protein
MALRFKIGAGFSIFIVVFLGCLSLYQLQTLNGEIQGIMSSDADLIKYAGKCTKLVDSFRSRQLNVFLHGEIGSYSELLNYLDEVKKEVKTGVDLGPVIASESLNILKLLDEYGHELGSYAGVVLQDRLVAFYRLSLRHNSVLNRLNNLSSVHLTILSRHQESVAEISKGAQIRMAVISVITVIIAFVLSIFFSQQLTLPIRRIKDLIERIRDGQYELTIRNQTGDELGQIFSSLAQMVEHIAIRDRLKIEKIDEEKRRFAVLANSLEVPFLLLNSEHRVAFANNPFLDLFRLGYDEIYETEWSKLALPPDLKDRISQAMMKNEWLYGVPMDVLGDSYAYDLNLSLLPVKSAKGKTISVVCCFKELIAKARTS